MIPLPQPQQMAAANGGDVAEDVKPAAVLAICMVHSSQSRTSAYGASDIFTSHDWGH